MFWQKLPAGMAWFMGRCLESTKKGPSDGCQLPVSVFLLLVNLDWNPWDFVAFKFNSITTRGFSIISGSNFPEGFPGVRYLTKLPSFKTTFWRGFNLENKFCFESTTTPHTHTHKHHHWRFNRESHSGVLWYLQYLYIYTGKYRMFIYNPFI